MRLWGKAEMYALTIGYLGILVLLTMILVPKQWYLNVIVSLTIVALHLLLGEHTVPIGHRGVVTILGGRVRLILKEGTYIRPLLLFFGIVNVDIRVRRARITRDGGTLGSEGSAQPAIEINPITDVTVDKARAFAEMAWTFIVNDPYSFLSVEDPFKNAISAVDGRTRNIIRTLKADDLAVIKQEEFLNGRIGQFEGILTPLNNDLAPWGLLVTNFFLQGIRFTDKVEGERELPYRERQQQAAETIEFRSTKKRVDIIKGQDVDGPEAWENEMARQGKPLRDSISFRGRKDDAVMELLGKLVGGWRLAHGERQQPHKEQREEDETQ